VSICSLVPPHHHLDVSLLYIDYERLLVLLISCSFCSHPCRGCLHPKIGGKTRMMRGVRKVAFVVARKLLPLVVLLLSVGRRLIVLMDRPGRRCCYVPLTATGDPPAHIPVPPR
jgi:hypothetical protein